MSNVTTEVCTLRLKYSQETFVLARDPLMGQILLGGLGALGVGQMWVDENPKYETLSGYSDAPLREAKNFLDF